MIKGSLDYGARLRDLCRAANVTGSELEHLTLAAIERAGLKLTAPIPYRWVVFAAAEAQILGVSLGWLLAGEGSAPALDVTRRAVAVARAANRSVPPRSRSRRAA